LDSTLSTAVNDPKQQNSGGATRKRSNVKANDKLWAAADNLAHGWLIDNNKNQTIAAQLSESDASVTLQVFGWTTTFPFTSRFKDFAYYNSHLSSSNV